MVGLVLLPGKNVPVLERSTAIFVEGSWLGSVANDFGPKYRSRSTALFPHGTCSSTTPVNHLPLSTLTFKLYHAVSEKESMKLEVFPFVIAQAITLNPLHQIQLFLSALRSFKGVTTSNDFTGCAILRCKWLAVA